MCPCVIHHINPNPNPSPGQNHAHHSRVEDGGQPARYVVGGLLAIRGGAGILSLGSKVAGGLGDSVPQYGPGAKGRSPGRGSAME